MIAFSTLERVGLTCGLIACLALAPFAGAPRPTVLLQPLRAARPIELAVPPTAAPVPPGCRDDGSSGKRVLALYVHGDQQADRYRSQRAEFQQWLSQIDASFGRASKRHGGGFRQVRYVRDTHCLPVIEDVTIEQDTMQRPDTIVTALRTLGFDRPDRKYLIWYDFQGCGQALGIGGNDLSSWYNLYNFGPHYATVGTDCWGLAPTLHELLHILGAINVAVPDPGRNGQCWDDRDALCWDDNSLPNGKPRQVCQVHPGEEEFDNQIDCNGNDYFDTAPAPGSYLATHWNVADNAFLYREPALS